jgi:hypothetical protein
LQADLDGVIALGSNQLHVAAMVLQGRANHLDYCFNSFFEGFFATVFAAAAFLTHKKSPKFLLIALLYQRFGFCASYFLLIPMNRDTPFLSHA